MSGNRVVGSTAILETRAVVRLACLGLNQVTIILNKFDEPV